MLVNPRTYTQWLLHLPKKELAPFNKLREVQPALRTARLLFDMAPMAEDPQAMRDVAFRLWLAPFQLGAGRRKKKNIPEARRVLKEYEEFVGRQFAAKAVGFLRSLSRQQLDADRPAQLIPDVDRYVTYRSTVSGATAYIPKRGRKKWPRDDLSERIWEAYYDLKESGCPHPSKFIAQELGKAQEPAEDWTPQRVESRDRKSVV